MIFYDRPQEFYWKMLALALVPAPKQIGQPALPEFVTGAMSRADKVPSV